MTLACAIALAAPGFAAAQNTDPTAEQYKLALGNAVNGGGSHQPLATSASGGSAPSASSDTVGGLPFTGADLGILGIAAVTLVGGGMVLRAYSRREHAERG